MTNRDPPHHARTGIRGVGAVADKAGKDKGVGEQKRGQAEREGIVAPEAVTEPKTLRTIHEA